MKINYDTTILHLRDFGKTLEVPFSKSYSQQIRFQTSVKVRLINSLTYLKMNNIVNLFFLYICILQSLLESFLEMVIIFNRILQMTNISNIIIFLTEQSTYTMITHNHHPQLTHKPQSVTSSQMLYCVRVGWWRDIYHFQAEIFIDRWSKQQLAGGVL